MKKIIAMALALVLVAGLSIGGTLAYLKDQDSDVNTMTMHNVHIEQVEQERNASGELTNFTQDKPAYPVVGPIEYADEKITINGGEYELFTPELKNVVDKIVTVKNTGTTDAYIRTIVAIEAPDGDPNDLIHININDGMEDKKVAHSPVGIVSIDGVKHYCAVFTYNEALAVNAVSAPSLLQVFLDSKADNDYCNQFGETWDIQVLSQGVQAAGFENASTALNTAFGEVTSANIQSWFGVQ